MRTNKKFIKISLLLLTLVLFVVYYLNNQDSFSRISDLSILQILLILVGQSLILAANAATLCVIVSFSQKRMHPTDAIRVTAYSSLINFFGFLQGGVGFRGVYLKKYFAIPLKRYLVLTTVQYLITFGLAGLMIFAGVSLTTGAKGLLTMALIGAAVLAAVVLAVKRFGGETRDRLMTRFESVLFALHSKRVLLMACSIALQLTGSLLAYGVALDAIGAHVTLGGLLVFSGISQFSIVIALTPGAIGIREGLLLIVASQMLLSTNDIIVASTIDRIVYFITLAILTPIALSARHKIEAATQD